MKIVSFFAGAGGLDLGFEQAGFNVIWANEYDKDIWDTYKFNHPNTVLNQSSITDILDDDVPDCDGIIGGPPCQSWSAAGARRGIRDSRGQLFYHFIRMIEIKKPKFFLAENVPGMLSPRNSEALNNIKNHFSQAGSGYNLSFQRLNASDYGVPQDRKRVFFIGIRKDLNTTFSFPEPLNTNPTLKEALEGLPNVARKVKGQLIKNQRELNVPNHEYLDGGYSTIYMSRNRVRSWEEPSFTIQAGGRHAPLHPKAPKMILVGKDQRIFKPGHENKYRRLTIRECARIQTFPNDFIFKYDNILHGYKMVGNAVPVELARNLAEAIRSQLN